VTGPLGAWGIGLGWVGLGWVGLLDGVLGWLLDGVGEHQRGAPGLATGAALPRRRSERARSCREPRGPGPGRLVDPQSVVPAGRVPGELETSVAEDCGAPSRRLNRIARVLPDPVVDVGRAHATTTDDTAAL
jgi:hypothetical protein